MEEMNRLTITLPWPDSRLMPNRKNGRHWTSTQDAKIRARQDGYFAALAALSRSQCDITGRVHMRVTFCSPDGRHRDLDNMLAWIKPQVDGIAKALGIDDRLFCPITIDAQVDVYRKGFVMVEIG